MYSPNSSSSSMAKPTCSHWWHAPIYVSISIILAFVSISSLKHSTPKNALQSTHALAHNASRALRAHGGFHTIATLIHISPDLFFTGPQSTIFAIEDSAITNLSIPPWEMRQLLHYHSTNSTLPISQLVNKTPPFCFKTLLQNRNLVVTKTDPERGSVMINSVLVSQPDLFLEGPVVIHGISEPFDMNSSLSCEFSNQSSLNFGEEIEWTQVVRFLSSNGFVSFAIGLNAVLDGIIQDYDNLGSVTIFAPPNSGFISSASPFLGRILRVHIVNPRFSYIELAAAGVSSLRTLVPGFELKISKFDHILTVNGVEITKPDMYSTKNFVIHGISRAFDLDEISSSSDRFYFV